MMTREQRNELAERYSAHKLKRCEARDYRQHLQERDELLKKCFEALPQKVFSRCPFTQGLHISRFDPFDVTGLWWLEKTYWVSDRLDGDQGIQDRRGPHFRVTTGAVRWPKGKFPKTLPACSWQGAGILGGTKPYIIPGILREPETIAVIRGLTMEGGVMAYAISYYSTTEPSAQTLTQTWRADTFSFPCPDGRKGWNQDNRPWSFDFSEQVAANRVLWMLPEEEDPNHRLRSGSKGCPYLGLAGPRKRLRVHVSSDKESNLFHLDPPHNETIEPFE